MNWFKSYSFWSYWWASYASGGGPSGAPAATADNWLIRARRRGRR